jgi:hypothetical protein
MKNSKFVIIFAICGFLLSFAAGLFSHSGFVHIFLVAAIFAIVFGALAFFIQFLMDGVLNINGQTIPAENAAESAPKTGGLVDITVQDEELPAEENSPQFFVGNNHQMLNRGDYSSKGNNPPDFSTPVESSVADIDTIHEMEQPVSKKTKTESIKSSGNTDLEEGFVPVSLQENAENISGKEAVVSDKTNSAGDSDYLDDVQNLENDTLDELPDLKDLKTPGSDDSIIEDSDFSKAGASKKNDEKTDEKDAAVMAKAISTVLAKDKEN